MHLQPTATAVVFGVVQLAWFAACVVTVDIIFDRTYIDVHLLGATVCRHRSVLLLWRAVCQAVHELMAAQEIVRATLCSCKQPKEKGPALLFRCKFITFVANIVYVDPLLLLLAAYFIWCSHFDHHFICEMCSLFIYFGNLFSDCFTDAWDGNLLCAGYF